MRATRRAESLFPLTPASGSANFLSLIAGPRQWSQAVVIGFPLEIKKKDIKPGTVVLELTGRITMGPDCWQIEKEVEQLLQQNQKHVILDLSGISMIDSTGIGQIVKCLCRLKNFGGSLRLAGLKGMVDGVFKITKVDQVIGIYPTAMEAAANSPSEAQD
jgi:anti-sigma B factor antagonist